MKIKLPTTALMLSVSALSLAATKPQSLQLADQVDSGHRSALNLSNPEMRAVNIPLGGAVLYSEDFQSEMLPPGWMLFNVDGLTPNSNVSQFTDAWIVAEDSDNLGDFNLQSTSWYSPAGTSNDWAITPLISIQSASVLSWRAEAQDPSYPDGYEVYISTTTADVAGCTVDPAVFSVASESGGVFTQHVVNLAAAGFANEDIYVCFRNNSTDQFILMVDDISVVEGFANDLAVDSVAANPEYTLLPDFLSTQIPLGLTVQNLGNNSQSNISVSAEILIDGVPSHLEMTTVTGPLANGQQQAVDLGSYMATQSGIYQVVYTVTLDGVSDDDPANNSVTINDVLDINADTIARDDGILADTLGIGTVSGGEGFLGQTFEFTEPVNVIGTEFVHNNSSCDVDGCTLDGENTRVEVYQVDSKSGLPSSLIGTSENHAITMGPVELDEVLVSFNPPLNLLPGKYLFAVVETENTGTTADGSTNIQLAYSADRFAAGETWVSWPGTPWTNSEAFNFFPAYMVRPKISYLDLIFENGFE